MAKKISSEKLQDETYQRPQLEEIDFLQGLPEEKQEYILMNAIRKNYRKGSFVFQEGDLVDGIYFIEKGRIKLSTFDNEGREKIVGMFTDHDTIWEGIFLAGSRYPYAGVCQTAVTAFKIPRSYFEEALSDVQVALRTIGMLSIKLHDANERNMLLSIADPAQRIAGFMIYRRQRTAEKYLTLKLDDIASSVALRPETVSRKLKEMERLGLIRKHGQSSFEILNFTAFEDFSNGIYPD